MRVLLLPPAVRLQPQQHQVVTPQGTDCCPRARDSVDPALIFCEPVKAATANDHEDKLMSSVF